MVDVMKQNRAVVGRRHVLGGTAAVIAGVLLGTTSRVDGAFASPAAAGPPPECLADLRRA
jgi:hypothetical protein